jgi:hypothetical protein
MADVPGPFRIVGPSERRATRRPGPAVVLILLYGLLFAGALWMLRARSPLFHREKTNAQTASPPRARPETAESFSRSSLLSGEGLSPVARDEYFLGLSTRCCTCGCESNLRDCIVSDQACQKSPEMAGELMEQLK